MKDAKVQVMGIDAGGTMTDTFFVKENGSFVVGKAQSNPEDESLAIYNSSQDALSHWKSLSIRTLHGNWILMALLGGDGTLSIATKCPLLAVFG